MRTRKEGSSMTRGGRKYAGEAKPNEDAAAKPNEDAAAKRQRSQSLNRNFCFPIKILFLKLKNYAAILIRRAIAAEFVYTA